MSECFLCVARGRESQKACPHIYHTGVCRHAFKMNFIYYFTLPSRFFVYFLALHLQWPHPAARCVAFLTFLKESAPSSIAFLISSFVTLKQGHMYLSFPITAPVRERCRPLPPVRNPACRVPWDRGRTGRNALPVHWRSSPLRPAPLRTSPKTAWYGNP